MGREMTAILATDCGSTTTKAILIERVGEEYRQTFRGEAPTTVEAPFDDVTRGVLNAIQEVEELSGRTILDGETILTPAEKGRGVDIYVSTSSAGGGLQMMVAGVVMAMTAESAQRCALGAGAIVMDVLASNDGRAAHEKIERIRVLRPDMILLSGGTDGGTVSHVVELAEYIRAADPRPRLGGSFKLPVIFAGNKDARGRVQEILGDRAALVMTDNIRPILERENLGPARHTIHDLFLEHVMAQAPGYGKLMGWTGAPIMPTPAAVGLIMEQAAKAQGLNLLGVDIGGATTDVFSVVDGQFTRTVSANLGMSYSVSNVLAEAGIEKIERWLVEPIAEQELRNRIKNKMIRPTTIPQTPADLALEQAIAREALRLAFDQHKALAVSLKGVQQERTIADAFEQAEGGKSLIDLYRIDLIIGSGGILSHAPRRAQAMMMMVDAYQPLGLTQLAVDSIFMMPHLGVLSQVNERAATEVFLKDCLVPLGSCLAADGKAKRGEPCFSYTVRSADGRQAEGTLRFGELLRLELPPGVEADLQAEPAKGVDLGAGKGRPVTLRAKGGVVGLILDARGRPLFLADEASDRAAQLRTWAQAVNLYPA
ncbi:MAG: methylaspartate mutase [Candidatus Methylomirabilota bacterium]|nr:methylaspartate mutase [candidate division NC10 bacterium]PWB47530.1 MAG: methylaspartate mutase [candidate division NC10 bacterium]